MALNFIKHHNIALKIRKFIYLDNDKAYHHHHHDMAYDYDG